MLELLKMGPLDVLSRINKGKIKELTQHSICCLRSVFIALSCIISPLLSDLLPLFKVVE